MKTFCKAGLAIVLFVVGAGSVAAQSAPSAVVQRTTLIVADVEKSIAFYERLGLAKISDEAGGGGAEVYGAVDLPLTADPTRSRLVVMSGGGTGAATIALLWYDRPPLASARGNLIGLGTGDTIISIQVTDLEGAFGRLEQLDTRFHKTPTRTAAGGAAQRMYAYDPDGHMIEISQAPRFTVR